MTRENEELHKESPAKGRVSKQKGVGSEVRSQQDNNKQETHKADLSQAENEE